jgi:hypothetical protein
MTVWVLTDIHLVAGRKEMRILVCIIWLWKIVKSGAINDLINILVRVGWLYDRDTSGRAQQAGVSWLHIVAGG